MKKALVYTRNSNANGTMVWDGYEVELHGVRFTVYKNTDGEQAVWHVIDVPSGLSVASGLRRKEAIANYTEEIHEKVMKTRKTAHYTELIKEFERLSENYIDRRKDAAEEVAATPTMPTVIENAADVAAMMAWLDYKQIPYKWTGLCFWLSKNIDGAKFSKKKQQFYIRATQLIA